MSHTGRLEPPSPASSPSSQSVNRESSIFRRNQPMATSSTGCYGSGMRSFGAVWSKRSSRQVFHGETAQTAILGQIARILRSHLLEEASAQAASKRKSNASSLSSRCHAPILSRGRDRGFSSGRFPCSMSPEKNSGPQQRRSASSRRRCANGGVGAPFRPLRNPAWFISLTTEPLAIFLADSQRERSIYIGIFFGYSSIIDVNISISKR